MSFAEQLKQARLAQGLTQQQVADLMGITNSTYCGYETGKRQPDVAKIKQLANILQTSGDTLLETGFRPRSEDILKTSALSGVKRRLIDEIGRMSEPEIAAVRVFVDSMEGYKKAFGPPEQSLPGNAPAQQ